LRWGNPRKIDNIEDPGVDGRIMVRWIFRKWVWGEGGIKYITLARDKDRWREFVNPVMKLWVP